MYQLGVGAAFVHLTHNPVGVAALGWLHALCFIDQTKEEYYGPTLTEALASERT